MDTSQQIFARDFAGLQKRTILVHQKCRCFLGPSFFIGSETKARGRNPAAPLGRGSETTVAEQDAEGSTSDLVPWDLTCFGVLEDYGRRPLFL